MSFKRGGLKSPIFLIKIEDDYKRADIRNYSESG